MNAPNAMEVYSSYRRHLGPKFEAAGIGMSFQADRPFGIDFAVECSDPLVIPAIRRGVEERVSELFNDLRCSFRACVTRIVYDPVDSCARAFYLAARAAIDQAFIISNSPTE